MKLDHTVTVTIKTMVKLPSAKAKEASLSASSSQLPWYGPCPRNDNQAHEPRYTAWDRPFLRSWLLLSTLGESHSGQLRTFHST